MVFGASRATEQDAKSKLKLVCMADVEPTNVDYFLEPYIARGKVTLIEGDPEVGKSWLTLAIAAKASTGGELLGHQVRRCSVLLLTAEDDLGDTVRIRLDKLGANVENVHVLENKFSLNEAGMLLLDAAIEAVTPEIVIIDPVIAYTDVKTDIYRPNQVRAMMNLLKERAELHDLAMVVVRHFKKGAGKAIHKGVGSVDYSAAARSLIVVVADEDDKDRRIMSHAKCSYARKGPTYAYRLDNGLHWEGEVDITANQLVEDDPDAREQHAAKQDAKLIIRAFLADGEWHPSNELMEWGKQSGISERHMHRVRRSLKVEVQQRAEGWWCRLMRKAA